MGTCASIRERQVPAAPMPGFRDSPDESLDTVEARKMLASKFMLPVSSPEKSAASSRGSSSGSKSKNVAFGLTLDTNIDDSDLVRRRRHVLKDAELLRQVCAEGSHDEAARILRKYTAGAGAWAGGDASAGSGGSERSGGSDDALVDGLFMANIPDAQGNTAVSNACIFGNLACLEVLLACPAVDVSGSSRKDAKNGLHLAAYNGHAHLVALLAQHIHLDSVDGRGNTAAHWAAENNFIDVLHALLDANACLKMVNHQGMTVLAVARKKGRRAMEPLLVSRGGVVAAARGKGRSASLPALPSQSILLVGNPGSQAARPSPSFADVDLERRSDSAKSAPPLSPFLQAEAEEQ